MMRDEGLARTSPGKSTNRMRDRSDCLPRQAARTTTRTCQRTIAEHRQPDLATMRPIPNKYALESRDKIPRAPPDRVEGEELMQ